MSELSDFLNDIQNINRQNWILNKRLFSTIDSPPTFYGHLKNRQKNSKPFGQTLGKLWVPSLTTAPNICQGYCPLSAEKKQNIM